MPLSFEVFAGNRNDVTTVEQIVTEMEGKYGAAQRVWVMDRGMVGEKNIAFLRQRNARHLAGTPKAQLRDFEKALLDNQGWHSVQSGLEARLIAHPDGKRRRTIRLAHPPTSLVPSSSSVLCRSTARAEKERAMLARQTEKLCAELQKIDTAPREKPDANIKAVGRRIGRWLGKYPAAAKVIQATLERDSSGSACALTITSHVEKGRWKDKAHGAYLLRTNCTETDPAKLWRCFLRCGAGTSNSHKPKPHSAPPRATSNCAPSTTKKPSESKRTSSHASWHSQCGGCSNNG